MIGDDKINLKIGDPIIVNNYSMYYGLKGVIKNIKGNPIRYIIESTEDTAVLIPTQKSIIGISPHCVDLDKVKFREKRFSEILDK